MQYKKPLLFVFIAYIWSKTLLGLALNPYRSVRDVTRNKVLVPVVFSPLFGLIILFVIGRLGSFLFDVHGVKRSFMALILSSALISILLWQLLLVYLLLSFYLAFRRK